MSMVSALGAEAMRIEKMQHMRIEGFGIFDRAGVTTSLENMMG